MKNTHPYFRLIEILSQFTVVIGLVSIISIPLFFIYYKQPRGSDNPQNNQATISFKKIKFPLPPPQPSAMDNLPKSFFPKCNTLNDLNTRVSGALNKCGYIRKSYFYVPNGFALVTQLEQINEDGTPKAENERWTYENSRNGFSIKNYFHSLLFAKPGFYRTIVFIFTDSLFSLSETFATREQANKWLISGTNRLPNEIGKIRINNNYSFDVLIHEFKKNETEPEAQIIIPSSISGRTHLSKNKFLEELR